ncbi:GatB/YqeY domain-containing protein [Rhodovulum sp. DZ06]|uniref:GatB/YqeY domain-containing protein n=1 Tax=Rhodovulum sp. DZ06 TaxID=3425126 RepID=UPI003D32F32A
MRNRIKAALEDALESDDRTRVATLRLICAAIKDRDMAARGADDGPDCMTDPELVQILSQMISQREESAQRYEESGRIEDARREHEEIEVIREFLPRPLSEEEARKAISEAIAETKAKSIRDMGAVMGTLKSRYRGRMDFCKAGAEIRSALG